MFALRETKVMKSGIVIIAGLAAFLVFPINTRAANKDLVRTRFQEVDTLFANPGQGWMSQTARGLLSAGGP